MGKYVYGVKYYKLGPFKNLVSCGCHYHTDHIPTYTIETRTASTGKTGYKDLINWISIQCECCKSISIHDVEGMEIYEEDVEF